MTFSKQGQVLSEIQKEIVRRSGQLETPGDYWNGRSFDTPLLPQNVIIFHRDSANSLVMGEAFRSQHHRYVLITAVRGGGDIGVDTQIYSIKEGQSLLVHPFQAHWYANLNRPTMYWIFVTFEHEPDERLEVLRDIGAIGVGALNLSELRGFMKSWQVAFPSERARLRLAEWLYALADSARKLRRTDPPIGPSTGHGGWIAEINRFVFENRDENITLAQVARRLGISASLLRSRFHQFTGKSIGRYVRELKLQYSCQLLHGTMLSISEIAERCGYESVFSFSRAFHKAYKFSPSAYRKNVTS